MTAAKAIIWMKLNNRQRNLAQPKASFLGDFPWQKISSYCRGADPTIGSRVGSQRTCLIQEGADVLQHRGVVCSPLEVPKLKACKGGGVEEQFQAQTGCKWGALPTLWRGINTESKYSVQLCPELLRLSSDQVLGCWGCPGQHYL